MMEQEKRLVQAVRGKDYRAAFKAIARLRAGHGPEVLGTPRGPLDEQRSFQDRAARTRPVQTRAVWTVLGWLSEVKAMRGWITEPPATAIRRDARGQLPAAGRVQPQGT